MATVAKLKGTSAGSFTIGLKGATLYQGTSTSLVVSPQTGDLFIQTGSSPKVLQYSGSVWLQLTPVDQWAEVTTTATLSSNTNYFANTSSAAFTITLPSSPNMGDRITIIDGAGTFAVNNLTVHPGSGTIMGQTGKNLILNTNNVAVDLVYYNSTYGWRIIETSSFNYTYA